MLATYSNLLASLEFKLTQINRHEMHNKSFLTVPLKATESTGLHWIIAPLKWLPFTGKQLQASSSAETATATLD